MLLIHGEQDAISIEEAEENARALASAPVVRVAEAGHMPFFENPEPSFAAALAFLDAEEG